MNFDFEISIPAEKEESDPTELVMKMTYGVITHVIITNPAGARGLSHLKIFYHEFQLYPLNTAGNYHGDQMHVEFNEYQPLVVVPYHLKAKGWNTDETYLHRFTMNFTVLRPEEMGREIPSESLRALKRLIGKEYEV